MSEDEGSQTVCNTSTESYLDSPIKGEGWWKRAPYVPLGANGGQNPPSPAWEIQGEGVYDRDLRKRWTANYQSRVEIVQLMEEQGGGVFSVIGDDSLLDLLTKDRRSNCCACSDGKPYDCMFFWDVEPLLSDALAIFQCTKNEVGKEKKTNYHRKNIVYEFLNRQFTGKLPVCCIYKLEFAYPKNKKNPVPYNKMIPSYTGKKVVYNPNSNPSVVDLCPGCLDGGKSSVCDFLSLREGFLDRDKIESLVTGYQLQVEGELEAKYGGWDKVPACVADKVNEYFGQWMDEEEETGWDLLRKGPAHHT